MLRASAVLCCVGMSLASVSEVTPSQKVVQLLEDLSAKSKAEKELEAETFAEFSKWCASTADSKGDEIQQGTSVIEKQLSIVASNSADSKKLGREITVLDGDVARWNADLSGAKAVRSEEGQEYKDTHLDLTESVYALDKAISTLKKRNFDVPQTLLQTVAQKNNLPASLKLAVVTLLQQAKASGSFTPPQADAYEFQSKGIITMLEELKDKFDEELNTCVKREANSKHAFNMMELDLSNQISYAEEQRSAKASLRGEKNQAETEARESMRAAQKEKAADQKYLNDAIAECRIKSEDFAARQELRAGEIVAIQKAISILSSDAVSANAAKHLPALAQQSASFVQLSASSPKVAQLTAMLQTQATRLGSKALALVVATLVTSGKSSMDDPFVKVRGMIKQMISKLQQEAASEAEAKSWCDGELRDNKLKRDSTVAERNSLQAKVDELTSAVARLGSEMAALEAGQAENSASLAEATAQRNKEHKSNSETVADCKVAQEAISQAVSVLKEFYHSASQATALVQVHRQTPASDAPTTFSAPYTGHQTENGGVLAVLEVMISDFARLESDTSSAEAMAQQEFDGMKTDLEADNAAKHAEHLEKLRLKQRKEISLERTKNKHLRRAQEQVDAAQTYYVKLQPICMENNLSFEDRVKRREEEIVSLREALKILEGEA